MKVAYRCSSTARRQPGYADKGENFGNRGYLADVNRREELAKADPRVRTSTGDRQSPVGHFWATVSQAGRRHRPHNPPSHPELLDRSASVRDAGFDLKQ
jgi:hypothetical protein